MMKARQNFIVDRLEHVGACGYQELADLLSVSTMTVRRDVDALAKRGLVIKTLAGVQQAKAPAYFYETDLLSRLSQHGAEKRAIADAAISMLQRGQTVFIDGSTTCLELAKLVAERTTGLTVITNSALASLELGRSTDNMIVGIGGQYDAVNLNYVGPTAEDQASKFFVDKAFVSTKGFMVGEGTFESALATFRVKQIMAKQAAELVLLVDHSKFGERALCRVLAMDEIDTVVTDAGVSDHDVQKLEALGKKVVVAEIKVWAGRAKAGAPQPS